MLAKAEQHDFFSQEFQNLAKAFLRLAEQADRSVQLGLPLEPDDSTAHQRHQPSGTLDQQPQQQQQQQQPKDKDAE